MADDDLSAGAVSDEEMEAAYSVPAQLVSRFVLTVVPTGIRIAFGELVLLNKVALFRSAVAMSPEEAVELRDLLTKMLAPYEDHMRNQAKASTNANG